MKKIVVLAAVLAFLALPDSQAAKGKPIRWQATFINDGTANLTGPAVFVGGQDQVNINNGVGTHNGENYYYLELQVFNPSLVFNLGGFTDSGNPAPAPYGLPNTDTSWPQCVADFLNSAYQPTADYPHITLRFTTCGYPFADLMAMGEGQILPVHMNLMIFSHIWGCPANSPFTQETFLNLYMGAHGYYAGAGSTYDVYIKRVGNTWTAYVDTVFDNPDYPNLPPAPEYTSAAWPGAISDNIFGQYATCSSSQAGKKGKTTWTTTYHYTWAKAPLKFQIAFTKI